MPPVERDATLESPRTLRHQRSESSDNGRALTVPMWDSSDPERAPPPLPLNPQSPSVGPSRPGTSTTIQSAHAALTEKAREANLTVNPYLSKRLTEVSPERPLPRPNPHRRMQSVQTPSVRERGLMIEGIPSSPASPEKSARPETPTRNRESITASPDKESQRGTPGPGPSLTPIVRPIVRRPQQQSILGENTPPQSATMLALQNMPASAPKEAETQTPPLPALSNVTNNSTAAPKPQETMDSNSLSNQIVALTNIATSLQKEMAALSRRSRDNATDLMSLKQATNSRDEDIRKTLRDLMGNLAEKTSSAKDPFYNGFAAESKTHNIHASPPSSTARGGRPISLTRIPSPNSLANSIDRDSVCTPSMSAADAPATIALLEKIIRDMGTREGQDLLITRLTEVAEKLAGMASATKVEELLRMIKKHPSVAVNDIDSGLGLGPRDMGLDDESSEIRPRSQSSHGDTTLKSVPSDLVNEDFIRIIRSIKDSVSQGGGLTAEVKALVRELRGEVLGMGRELGRRLDEVANNGDRSIGGPDETDEMRRVINEGLDELRNQMDHLLREHRRQSSATASSRASHVDYQEIYNAMRAALKDASRNQSQQQHTRDDIIDAVREAWENYKPEIEVQQFGLERDEILACLKEGLQGHAARNDQPVGATREEVFRAVVEGLKHFVPPQVETPASLSRDEILEAVRECLEEFEFPVAPSALGNDLSRDDMVQAVKEGLDSYDLSGSRALTTSQPHNEGVMAKLAEIIELMRLEFRSVSAEARENVAANGRDTEQILDATKDGFERLRQDMEEYVGRISAMSTRGDSSEELAKKLDGFRDEISRVLENQIESLRDSVNMSLVPASPAHNPVKDGLDGIWERLDRIRGDLQRPLAGTTEILDAIQEGMSDLHIRIEKLGNRPPDLTANDEILDALREGLDSVRSEMEAIRDSREKNERAIAPYEGNASGGALRREDIDNLEAMITHLHTKVEALVEESSAGSRSMDTSDTSSRTEEMFSLLKEVVEGISKKDTQTRERAEGSSITPDTDLKEDVQAVETILRNTKARLDDLIDGEQAVRKEHVDGLEAIILETRESLSLIMTQMDNAPRQEDITKLESLISHVAATYEEIKERTNKEFDNPEKVTRTDVEAVEAVCLDVKGLVNELVKGDLAALATKEDFNTIISDLKERIESVKDSASKAVAERDAETIDVNARIREVKEFLSEFQDLTKSRLEDGIVGVESVGKLLEQMSELAENNASVGVDLKEMFETMKAEFEESRTGISGVKYDNEEKFQQTTDILASKIDERVDELVAKYDEFQTLLDERAKAGEERDEATEAAVVGTKAVADELKLLIDTLGSTVTESLERMEEASKTVFTRVEDLVTRADENHTEDKEQHEQTRERVKEAMEAVDNLREPVSEMQPKVLEAVKGLLEAINEHYNYTKTATSEIQQKIEEAKPEIPEKYDDSGVQEKLDKLVRHNETTDETLAKLDAALTEKFESIASNTGEKLDTLVSGSEALDAFVKEKLEALFVNSEATGEAVSQFDAVLKERLETLTANNTERLDGILVNTEATGEAFSQFDTSVKEKIDNLLATTVEKLDSILVNTEATGEGFSQLDSNVRERLDKIFSNTSATTESFSNLDMFLKEKLVELADHIDATGESVTQLDADLKERLERLSEQTLAAGKAFDRLDDSVEAKLAQLIEHTQSAGKAFDRLDGSVEKKLEQLIEHTQTTGKAFERLDGSVENKLEQLIEHTQTTGKAFDRLDGSLEAKLAQVIEHSQTAGEAFNRLDGSVEEKLAQVIEHSQAAGEAFNRLDSSVEEKLAQLIEHSQAAGEAFNRLDGSVGEKLEQLIEHTQATGKSFAELDDRTQEKLDTLVGHSHSTGKALERLDALDEIHGQVVATAASVSEFLASQTQRISDEHRDRERAAQEAAVILERRNAEKVQVEGSIAVLREEEARLKESVLSLRSENESLSKQKTRLAADVSSLETALNLRKEELREMEERAESLERRILEGVMNHSRVLLMSRNQGSESMSRKRVRTKGGEAAPEKKPVLNAALSKRNLGTPGGSPATGGSRRIVSLSQIDNNVPTGGFKRSHSVKAPSGVGRGGTRKRSWGGDLAKGFGEFDKENVDALKEEEEGVDREGAGVEATVPEGEVQLVSLQERDAEAEVEREMTGRSSGSTLTVDEDGIAESEADLVSVADGPVSERDNVSEAGTLRRNRRATDVSSSIGTEYSDDCDGHSHGDESEGSDVPASVVGTTLSEGLIGNEVALVEQD
ncbi:hypothetical protein VUR80DRAFT_5748 [Thermomyces stellatus]